MRYGERLTHRWKGRLLTALSTAALLAVSAGTALAQNTGVTIAGPAMNTVAEGDTATYNVTVTGYVGVAADANTPNNPAAFNVVLESPGVGGSGTATEGELADLNSNAHVLSVSFDPPSNSSTTNRLRFTESKTISLATLHDNDAENESFTLTFPALTGVTEVFTTADTGTSTPISLPGNAPTALTIDDDETQTYVLSASGTRTEGATVTVTGTAMPAHVNGSSGSLDLYTNPPTGYTLGATTLTIGTAPGTVTIVQDAGDGNRVADTVTLSAYRATQGPGADTLVASLDIEFADANVLPAVKVEVTNSGGTPLDPQPTSVAEGESIHVRATAVDSDGDPAAFAEALEIMLRVSASGAANASDIVAPAELTIAANATPPNSNAVQLTIFGPDQDVGDEMLTLDAVVSGEAAQGSETSTSSGVLTLTITDETDKLIWPLPEDEAYPKIMDAIDAGNGDDDVFNPYPQESFTVDASGLFGRAEGHTATYSVTADTDAVSVTTSGNNVTVTAMKEGDAKVTITGTAALASSGFAPSQSISNVASITFPVEVRDTELTVTVAAVPDAIDEGGTSEITATASRMVTAADGAVAIELLVVPEDGATLADDSITIAEGSNSGSVMLTAAADDDTNDEEVTVIARGSGITGDMRVTIAVNDTTDAPVTTPTVRAVDGASEMIAAAIMEAAGEAEWMVGGSTATVDMSELFEADEGVTVRYAGDSSDESVISATVSGGTMLSLTPVSAGTATITVTGSDAAGDNVAEVTHDATVALQDLVVTVTASADEVDEGDSVTLTAAANRAVTSDIVLQVTATGDTAAVTVEDITISTGEMSGTAMVMAVEDDDTANAEVDLVVSGSALDSPETFSIAVIDNDRTVNALTQAEVDAVFGVAVARAAGGDNWMPGGNDATVDMSALFDIESGATVEYEAMSSADDMVAASASGSMLTLSAAATGSASITVTATDTSGDADDTATVSSTVTVGLLDLVVTLEYPANAEHGNVVEGESYDIVVSANRAVHADTMVTIMRDRSASEAGDSDYTVGSATIMAESDSATAELMVMADDVSEGGTADGGNVGESLVLFGVVDGEQTDDLTFTIWDVAVPALPVIATWLLGLGLLGGGARQLYRRRRQG